MTSTSGSFSGTGKSTDRPITCATPAHLRVYRAFGVPRVFYGNELIDEDTLAWLAAELDADPDFTFLGFVDSVAGVRLMDEALRAAGSRRPAEVVVEVGARGGRGGVRDRASGIEVAEAVHVSGDGARAVLRARVDWTAYVVVSEDGSRAGRPADTGRRLDFTLARGAQGWRLTGITTAPAT